MPEKEYKYTDVKKLHIFFIFYHYFCIVYKYVLGTLNKEIIINVMLSTQSHGANATISSELHGASLCLANVVSGPWNIPSTQAVLSLASTKRYFQEYKQYIMTNLHLSYGKFTNYKVS